MVGRRFSLSINAIFFPFLFGCVLPRLKAFLALLVGAGASCNLGVPLFREEEEAIWTEEQLCARGGGSNSRLLREVAS